MNAGDTIWIVFVNQDGKLILAGRLKAAEVVDYLTAVRRLHDANLWDGDYYALAAEDAAEKINLINLGERALELRLKKSGSDRLTATNGKIRAQQLGSMRELTQESAQMLTEIWENAAFNFGSDDFDWEDDEIDEESAELLESCRRAVSEQPENADAHYNLGVAFDQKELPGKANAAYQKAIRLDPSCWAAYYNLGQNYLYSNELDKAKQSFITAISFAPEYAKARFMLGVVYIRLEDFEKSIAVIKEGLQYDPDDSPAHFYIGYSYFQLQNYEKAARWFEKSVEFVPDAHDTFYLLGKCYRHLGEKQKEFDAYRQAVELVPDFLDALFALGTVYAHLTETAKGERVTYFETGANKIEIKYLRLFYYYILHGTKTMLKDI